ncbi:FtsK/SpoIIIE family DNA translocase [Mongoliibacter ruber]|uniref:S-DNA-T family DNA segregation ATPase FtsK/SpoIIIE n=1 Tax=Mongoliibacter ruber TaxID=1750599 RepID=A0A2T0WIU9_9BACT|nr:DNA translocase FtsK [Mongoliibacter ruber]PRY86617.1 S-DNA-T family DNA segregation ATPase FtsK/SpoIIIE [Mongoliibacter ruber]
MASEKPRENTFRRKNSPKSTTKERVKRNFSMGFLKDKRIPLTFGIILLSLSLFLFFAFISYLFEGNADQSLVASELEEDIRSTASEARNWLGLFGAQISYVIIHKWFGIAAFLLPPFIFLLGFNMAFKKSLYSIPRYLVFALFFTFWLCLVTGYLGKISTGYNSYADWSGGFGYELGKLAEEFLGWGTFILIGGSLLIFSVFFFNIQQLNLFGSARREDEEDFELEKKPSKAKSPFDQVEEEPVLNEFEEESLLVEEDDGLEDDGSSWTIKSDKATDKAKSGSQELALNIESTVPEKTIEEPPVEEKKFSVTKADGEEKTAVEVQNLDPYDPTLDLPHYKYPTLELLNSYDLQKVTVTRQELEDNKNKIVETLVNFKIGIQEIKATIGPTVTLYEIVPDPGVKISKIKNLEDDIALSLAALGIRIIAPIPGKGTIGIEVPNKNRELVPARAVIGTEKFMKSDKDLPIALGKTISNEVFVVDLAKMPHLLMAGATGQGKSVGLNMILASLVYKKHPSQLKFVLVDPKKVELTLFNKIERHFLAKLPGSEEAIITDTKKVIYTLNSLCIEMDNRYDMLKDAGCRNLKEYNAKFIARKLNPDKGHRFMPYIVLVIDELADLMMTAGKEIEAPIARLAQLARAIGIHLVVATQRPSVNVITGIIKANFPARLSFRVTSKIDSRTILDSGGADQLIGQGDMLLSSGSEVTRLQCAFLDTPEVDAICDWIGEQKGYSDAYLLPEFEGEDSDSGLADIDLADRDPLFDDAARLIVMHQQGSTSLIQRKLKLGYNRAGRIVDQLEAAGIVGSFEGSKAREVLVQDEASLERLLNNL